MCIGLQKAGTGWLYDQLDSHPDFEMPPVKELHYFDKRLNAPGLRTLEGRLRQNLDNLNQWRERQHKRPMSPADLDFVQQAVKVRDEAGDIARYAALFGGQRLTGDITPAYSTLPEETVRQIAARFPELKIVLLLREPVSRAVSHLTMMVDLGNLPPETANNVSRTAGWFSRPEVQDRSRPSVTWRRWAAHFPRDRMRFYYFEDLCGRPEWLLASIVKFLGGDPSKPTSLPSDFNRKGRSRATASAAVRDYLADVLREETLACAELFGGHAAGWPESLAAQSTSP